MNAQRPLHNVSARDASGRVYCNVAVDEPALAREALVIAAGRWFDQWCLIEWHRHDSLGTVPQFEARAQ